MTDIRAVPEFSRLVQVDAIGVEGAAVSLQANAEECAALAERLDLQGIADLRAEVSLQRTAVGLVRLNVDFSANVVQSCAVTLEPVAAKVAEHFSILCEGGQKRGKNDEAGGEVFVDPFGEDPIEPLDDGGIDVGELVAQHLSLALDPYPRTPGIEVGVLREGLEMVGAEMVNVIAADDGVPEGGMEAGRDRESPFAVLESWRSGGKRDGGDGGGSNAA